MQKAQRPKLGITHLGKESSVTEMSHCYHIDLRPAVFTAEHRWTLLKWLWYRSRKPIRNVKPGEAMSLSNTDIRHRYAKECVFDGFDSCGIFATKKHFGSCTHGRLLDTWQCGASFCTTTNWSRSLWLLEFWRRLPPLIWILGHLQNLLLSTSSELISCPTNLLFYRSNDRSRCCVLLIPCPTDLLMYWSTDRLIFLSYWSTNPLISSHFISFHLVSSHFFMYWHTDLWSPVPDWTIGYSEVYYPTSVDFLVLS